MRPSFSRRTILTATAASGAAALGTTGTAEAAQSQGTGHCPPATAQPPTRELRTLLREIDPARIEATVRKLVSFGTRHTHSAQDDPVRGIGAARDWLLAELRSYAAASGGRMTAELQSYVQEPASRIPTATRITNVTATLRGSVTPDRVYIVSGHYDSRATDVMDATSDAPGADDDASGVAVVLELARVMAKRRPASTIAFAAVAGEEQGLYGAAHMAQQLKAAGADVQGMFTNDIVGSSTADDGTQDPYTLRLFAEGVPSSETPEQAAIRRSVGGENDSATRQLSRFVREAGPGLQGPRRCPLQARCAATAGAGGGVGCRLRAGATSAGLWRGSPRSCDAGSASITPWPAWTCCRTASAGAYRSPPARPPSVTRRRSPRGGTSSGPS
jgi:hypothetical protein